VNAVKKPVIPGRQDQPLLIKLKMKIMKNAFIKTSTVTLLLLLIFFKATSQSVPPAQGPPAVSGEPHSFVPTFLIINALKLNIQVAVDTANARIDRETILDIKISSFELKALKPYLTETKFTDRPNERIVRFPFQVDYTLHLPAIPNRHIYQDIDVFFYCKDWFSDSGYLKIVADVARPFLGDASIPEEVLSAILLNKLTTWIDNQIKSNLPPAKKLIVSVIAGGPCSCLSVDPGPGPLYNSGEIDYQYKPAAPVSPIIAKTVSVSVKRIKRLECSRPNGNILYSESENVYLEFFANQTARAFWLDNFREGEERALPENKIVVNKPGNGEYLILLAGIKINNFEKDGRFLKYGKHAHYGNGTRKLILKKSYWFTPPHLPGGPTPKPVQVWMNAYELTVEVDSHELVVH
jgi:hypothetical protein